MKLPLPHLSHLSHLPIQQRWMEQKHPMPVTVAIIHRKIKRKSRYLLIRRIKEPYAGKWALVGGKWDFGETLPESILREVREETGLQTTFVALRDIVNELIVPDSDSDQGAHFLLFVCEVTTPTDEAKEQSEGEVNWFTVKELRALNDDFQIVPTDYLMLEKCFKRTFSIPHTEAGVISRDGESIVRYFETVR